MQQATFAENKTQGLQDGMISSDMKPFMTHSTDIALNMIISINLVTLYEDSN